MTPFPDARRRVLSFAGPLETESVRLRRLAGRVLAGPLVCPLDVPGFDDSQVDGYAVRSADAGPRRVVGESAAGGPAPPAVEEGEAVRIFTGAPIPAGADAVAMQEDVRREGDRLLLSPVEPGENVRRRGEEIVAGARFEVGGRVATPPIVGLAASFGLTRTLAYRTPRVAIVATGDELVRPGRPIEAGRVYASNPFALAAALRPLGIDARTTLVGDDPARTRTALSRALERADVVVAVGGVSVGDHDLVRPSLRALGVEELLWRVAMKPGKPFYFGRREAKLVFGLPGNPVSAMVTFYLLVRPALRAMLGLAEAEEETTATLGVPIRRRDLRYEFVRATLCAGIALPVSAQGSHMQTGLAFADALIHVPDGVAAIEAGAPVTVTPLRWGY